MDRRHVDRDRRRLQACRLPRRVLRYRLFHCPRAHLDDHSRFLEQRDEQHGRHQPRAGVVPAHQCFEAHDAPGAQINLGLVEEHELLPLQRLLQLAFELEPLRDERIHPGRVKEVTVA